MIRAFSTPKFSTGPGPAMASGGAGGEPERVGEVTARLLGTATCRWSAGRTPDLGAGHSEEDIRAAEAAVGLRLPEDLRALYRTVSSEA